VRQIWRLWLAVSAVMAAATAMPAAGQVLDIGDAPAAMRRRQPGAEQRQAAPRAARIEGEALRAEPVAAPGGGVKVNLRGRYRSAVRRQADASGTARSTCEGPAAGQHPHE
jgi:hypothetical protein